MRYRVYDAGERFFDRYTVFEGLRRKACNVNRRNGREQFLGLDENAIGFSQFDECIRGGHLGKIVLFESLPVHVQEHIKARFEQ